MSSVPPIQFTSARSLSSDSEDNLLLLAQAGLRVDSSKLMSNSKNFFGTLSEVLKAARKNPKFKNESLELLNLTFQTAKVDPSTNKIFMRFNDGKEMALDAMLKELRARKLIADGCTIVIKVDRSLSESSLEYLGQLMIDYRVNMQVQVPGTNRQKIPAAST